MSTHYYCYHGKILHECGVCSPAAPAREPEAPPSKRVLIVGDNPFSHAKCREAVAKLRARVTKLEQDVKAERSAHEEIGTILLPLVGTGDGTSVDAAKRAAEKMAQLEQELADRDQQLVKLRLRVREDDQGLEVSDGFGSTWPPCEKCGATLQVMRPGDARCVHCENDQYVDGLVGRVTQLEQELARTKQELEEEYIADAQIQQVAELKEQEMEKLQARCDALQEALDNAVKVMKRAKENPKVGALLLPGAIDIAERT